MTMALGDETIKIHTDVALTGIALTCSLGAGSALIWNEVNTGSAPLDPPGWVEVAA
jgi:aconitase B